MKNIDNLKQKLGILTLFVCSISPLIAQNQTVNIGDVFVTEGTVMSIVGDFNNTNLGSFNNNGDVFAYSNWNNDGFVSFNSPVIGTANGLTRFIGVQTQEISGSEVSFLNNVLFSNNSAFPALSLSGSVSVATQANFTQGIVDNDTFGGTFIFEEGADHINASNDSFVDGSVVKMGDNPFTFPIGDASYFRNAGISEPANTSDKYQGKYFFESTTFAGYDVTNKPESIAVIDDAEFWTITRESGNSNVFVTLSYDDSTTPAAIINSPVNDVLVVAKWDEASQSWINLGGVVDTSNKTVTTIATVDDYGVFTLARLIEDEEDEEILVTNGVSPNGDGINDYFIIQNIQQFPNNKVEIFNRWGVLVFETTNYDSNNNVFRGYSEGRLTLNKGELLPSGTYFYTLSYDVTANGSTETKKQAGYLYLNGD